MKREELLGWLDSLIINSAELGESGDAKSWGYEEGILISRNEAEEIRTHLSLPPAEGAILDHQHDHLLDHPEGAEEIASDLSITIGLLEAEIDSLKDAYKKMGLSAFKREYSLAILSHKTALKILRGNATLHARKMAENNLREELIKYHDWIFDDEFAERSVNEYLKSKEQ